MYGERSGKSFLQMVFLKCSMYSDSYDVFWMSVENSILIKHWTCKANWKANTIVCLITAYLFNIDVKLRIR